MSHSSSSPKALRWASWLHENREYWILLALGTLGLMLGRWILIWTQAPADWTPWHADVLNAFWLGARFDLKILALLLGAPVLLLGLGLRAASARATRVWQWAWRLWCALVLLLINLLTVVNLYYFHFYQGPINGLVFGLADDDTRAVLRTIWHDFPVLWLLAAIWGVSAVQLALARWCSQRPPVPVRRKRFITVALASLLLTAGLVRGSLGTFPLRSMHMTVSSNAFTNHLVPSGALALYQAWQDRQRYDLGQDPHAGLTRYGYATEADAIRDAAFEASDDPPHSDWRWHAIPPWPDAPARPHVVLAVMESWGRQALNFDDAQNNDLLGRLRPWIKDGRLDYFDHALSSNNGTHPSLEALLLDTPLTPLTQRYGATPYDTASARMYQQAGYHTVYLTAGPESWRHMDVALLTQGFDAVIGETAIRERFPQASTHTWGVDDEWMFRYAQELLAEADARRQPLLLVMMSVTNHPPYRVPPSYTPTRLDVARLGKALATDADTGLSILQTYQYANDALGGFLDGLAASGVLDHTLFAATGDHNQRTIFAYPDDSALDDKYGVPIVMRIPAAYRRDGVAHTRQWTSHQDIFPTLWAHSLWGQRVPPNGRDLYAANSQPDAALSFVDSGIVVCDAGAVVNLAQPRFYQWDTADAHARKLTPVEQSNPLLRAIWQRERARMALRDWRIRSQALAPQ